MIVDERITAYINSLERELPTILKGIEETALKEGVPIIRKETQSFLRTLLSIKKPKHILEVGAAVGFSSLFMSEYVSSDCSITTIEKMEVRIEKAKANFKSAGKEDRITLLEGDAMEVLKELVDAGKTYDFIFMDAAKAQYIYYLPEILKLLSKEGMLVTDNVLQDGTVAQSKFGVIRRDRTIHYRMREYLYQLTHMEEFETSIIPVGDGVSLSILL